MAWKDLTLHEKKEWWADLVAGIIAFVLMLVFLWFYMGRANAQTSTGDVEIEIGTNASFTLRVNSQLPITQIRPQTVGAGRIDTINASAGPTFTTVPNLGGNNDNIEAMAVDLILDQTLSPGTEFVATGDIDGTILDLLVTITYEDTRTEIANLTPIGDLWSGSLIVADYGSLDTDTLALHTQHERVGFTGDERTIAWGQDGGPADWNEIRIFNRETGLLAHENKQIAGDAVEYKWTPTRTGHYWVELVACVLDDPSTPEAGDPFCSASSDSRDPQFTTPEFPQGWVLYFELKPPTDGGIEQ